MKRIKTGQWIPDRQELHRLHTELTITQLATRFKVSKKLIFYYLTTPDPPANPPMLPPHIANYWRYKWGWPEERIHQVGQQYIDSWKQ